MTVTRFLRSCVGIASLIAGGLAHATNSYQPVTFHLGSSPSLESLQTWNAKPVTLSPTNSVLTLDYGAEVGGWPFVEVSSATPFPAQIQLKFSEPFDGLSMPYSDGPFEFTNGLMDAFRTETFNISKPGHTESYLIQGGQRWQTITLLTNNSVTITQVGIRPSVNIHLTNSLPGQFTASGGSYEKVWSLGARAVQAACVEKGSQRSPWQVTPDGVLIRGQYTAESAKGANLGSYTLNFTSKIVQGGTGWKVAVGISGGYGPYFILNSGGPRLASDDQTLLPSNSLTVGFGFTIINQTILPSGPVSHYNVSLPIVNDKWYNISTTITPTSYDISVDGHQIASIPNAQYQPYLNPTWGSSTLTDGTWAFGPFLDQAAYYKDVRVSLANGSVVYENAMTAASVPGEYGVATNPHAVCLDGAKRDRLVWIGDFVHTARELAVSSGRYDFVRSMIDFEFEWQYPPGTPVYGFVPIQAFPGALKENRAIYYPSQFGEADYQYLFLLTVSDYWRLTGDVNTLRSHWSGIKFLVQRLSDEYLDASTGLLANSSAFWFTAQGTQSATAPTALFATNLLELSYIATSLGDSATATAYQALYAKTRTAINSQLWHENLGAYAVSLDQDNGTSLLAAAFTIRSLVANTSQATSNINRLANLLVNIGYKDSDYVGSSGSTQLSPNTQGFLLDALFFAHSTLNVSATTVLPLIKTMLNTYWPSMYQQNQYDTGCSWEYVYPDGSPGIGIFTSLCHPWGGAPTYVLSDYVLGVRRALNAESGEYEWVFDPAWEIVQGLGLTWVKGVVPLVDGGRIVAEWSIGHGGRPSMHAQVEGSRGTNIVVKSQH